MGQVVPFGTSTHGEAAFSMIVRGGAVEEALVSEFAADPLAWAWKPSSPRTVQDKAWLDRHARGWRSEVVSLGFHEVEYYDGTAPDVFLAYQVTVLFATDAHRGAWRRMAAARAEKALLLRVLARHRRRAASANRVGW